MGTFPKNVKYNVHMANQTNQKTHVYFVNLIENMHDYVELYITYESHIRVCSCTRLVLMCCLLIVDYTVNIKYSQERCLHTVLLEYIS